MNISGMRRLALGTLIAITSLALAGCSSDPGHHTPSPHTTATTPLTTKPTSAPTAALPLAQSGDLPPLTVGGAVVTMTSLSDLSVQGYTDSDVANAKRDGFVIGRYEQLVSPGSIVGISGATRFGSSAGALREVTLTAHGVGAIITRAPSLPGGVLSSYNNSDGTVGRNVYFAQGSTMYYLGYQGPRADEPGTDALVAAALKILARTATS